MFNFAPFALEEVWSSADGVEIAPQQKDNVLWSEIGLAEDLSYGRHIPTKISRITPRPLPRDYYHVLEVTEKNNS